MARLTELRALGPAVAVTVGLLLWPGTAAAQGRGMISFPDDDLALGPSIAYAYGPRSGYSLGFDTAYTKDIFALSLNLKYVGQPDYQVYGAQAEASVWLLVNLGGGIGYLGGTESGPLLHLFAGLPFPLDDNYFFEPYYRANFLFADDTRVLHEAGLMVKYSTFDF